MSLNSLSRSLNSVSCSLKLDLIGTRALPDALPDATCYFWQVMPYGGPALAGEHDSEFSEHDKEIRGHDKEIREHAKAIRGHDKEMRRAWQGVQGAR